MMIFDPVAAILSTPRAGCYAGAVEEGVEVEIVDPLPPGLSSSTQMIRLPVMITTCAFIVYNL